MRGESKSSPHEIQNYLGRVSGVLLDCVELHVEVPPVKFREISGDRTGETSAQIRERFVAARKRQQTRFAHKPRITSGVFEIDGQTAGVAASGPACWASIG